MRAALDALVRAEPRFAKIEAAAGPLPWRVRPGGFAGLLQAIVAQQVSSAAAAAIWARLRALPGAAVVVGDRRYDMEAARAHGLRAVGVTWGFGPPEELRAAGADILVDDPGDLVAAVTAPPPSPPDGAS